MNRSTIYALSTPLGRSAIGVIRVSGPDAFKAVKTMTRGGEMPSRVAKLANLRSENGLLDQALLLPFSSTGSYTGEPLIELHCHGSPPVLAAVMQALGDAGCRHAEPGEFTKRAFYNGKLDLVKVEGIRDLLNAETELQRQLAVSNVSGALTKLYENWRDKIVHEMAMLTAIIDFADDNEIEHGLVDTVTRNVCKLIQEIRAHTQKIEKSELVANGIKLVVVGEPNAGKSSIVNRLVNRSACIVSNIPGTTRDVVHVNLDIGGYKVVVGDTAGIRTITSTGQHDELEKIGISRALEALEDADIVMVVLPLDRYPSPEVLAHVEAAKQRGKPVLVIGNKSDLHAVAGNQLGTDLKVSSVTGAGFDDLTTLLATTCGNISGFATSKDVIGASQRTRELLSTQVLPGLEAAHALLEHDVILASAELQVAADGISKITGRSIGVNEVLDVVFGSFCIGK